MDTHVPCGHFSGGRGSRWRFHLLGYAAKEETMNVREAAAKFKTDEDCLTYLEQMRWPQGGWPNFAVCAKVGIKAQTRGPAS